MGWLDYLDQKASQKGKGIETLWQFVKFIVVSLAAFVVQTLVPLLIKLPMSEEFLNRPYEFWIFASDGANKNGLGIFIAAVIANILAQIVAFFLNKEKTFNSSANTKVTLPIYLAFTVALICFSAWLTPRLQGFLVTHGLGVSLSLVLTGAICGVIQFFVYFPVDKILFRKKKEK